jgi:predicted MFS family arabinose efflux permease
MALPEAAQTDRRHPNLWGGFATCLFIMLFFAMGGGAFLLLIVGYLEKRSVPVTEIGAVMSLLSIVEGSLCLLIGHFYKGKWTREILIGAMLLNLLGSLILSFQPMGVLVWVGAAFTGAGFGVFTVIMYVAALQRRPDNLSLGLAVGLYTACIAAGNGLGALISGWMTDQYGFTVSFSFAVSSYLVAVLCLLLLKNMGPRPQEAVPAAKLTQNLESAHKITWVLALLTAFTLASINMVFDILFPVYALRAGVSFTLIGSLSGIKMVLAATVRPFSGLLMARLNPMRFNNLSLMGLAAGTVLIPVAGLGFGLTAVIALLGATFGAVRTTSATLVIKDEDNPQVISRRISYYNTCLTLGQTISPWFIGILADRIAVTTALMVIPLCFMGLFGLGSLILPQVAGRLSAAKERTLPI